MGQMKEFQLDVKAATNAIWFLQGIFWNEPPGTCTIELHLLEHTIYFWN